MCVLVFGNGQVRECVAIGAFGATAAMVVQQQWCWRRYRVTRCAVKQGVYSDVVWVALLEEASLGIVGTHEISVSHMRHALGGHPPIIQPLASHAVCGRACGCAGLNSSFGLRLGPLPQSKRTVPVNQAYFACGLLALPEPTGEQIDPGVLPMNPDNPPFVQAENSPLGVVALVWTLCYHVTYSTVFLWGQMLFVLFV